MIIRFIAYAFLSFLFFKIFPEFAGYRSNTVIGALLMAITSGLILSGAEVFAQSVIGFWVQSFNDNKVANFPRLAIWALLAGAVVSMISTYLIAVGFSWEMFRSAFRGYRPAPAMFWAMAAIPPAVQTALRVGVFLRAIRLYRETDARR